MGFRTVFVKNGDRLKLKLDNLEVIKNNEHIIIPLSDIENVILEGDHTIVTSRLLAQMAKHHIDVIICDNKFTPCGIYLALGQYHRAAKRTQWQAQWSELTKLDAWTHIVTQKIHNQIETCSLMNVDEERIQLMEALKNEIVLGDDSNREGHVAKVYFNSLYGIGFTRDDDTFPNHCMDYGYAIVRAQMARCVVAAGLIPALGIHHCNEYNAFNLVDDLMEPFRPLMDLYILREVQESQHKYLSYELRLTLIDFLNQRIRVGSKKVYMMQAMNDYVSSFIRAAEQENWTLLHQITTRNYEECREK